MEGFTLPPFESTSILNDEDIICVTKKRANILCGDNSVDEVNTNLLLLVNEEFEKESSGYRSDKEDEEREEEKIHVERSPDSKKRKNSKHLKISKKRKHRSRNSDSAEDVIKSTVNVIDEPARNTKRSDPIGPIGEELKGGVPQVFQVTTKVPSRSARRKKAKRIWLREIAKAEKEVAGSSPKKLVSHNIK
jgi:coilin